MSPGIRGRSTRTGIASMRQFPSPQQSKFRSSSTPFGQGSAACSLLPAACISSFSHLHPPAKTHASKLETRALSFSSPKPKARTHHDASMPRPSLECRRGRRRKRVRGGILAHEASNRLLRRRILGVRVMPEHKCQMDIVGAGVWSAYDPRTCCGRAAFRHITVYRDKWWLCAQHYREHMELRGVLYLAGEEDANGFRI